MIKKSIFTPEKGKEKKYFLLRPSQRLKKRSDFERSRRVGRPFHGEHFLWVFTLSETATSRLGLVVTKKLFPRAVDRNRIKRVIREVFRKNPQLIPDGYDVVVIAKRTALEVDYCAGVRELMRVKKKRLAKRH